MTGLAVHIHGQGQPGNRQWGKALAMRSRPTKPCSQKSDEALAEPVETECGTARHCRTDADREWLAAALMAPQRGRPCGRWRQRPPVGPRWPLVAGHFLCEYSALASAGAMQPGRTRPPAADTRQCMQGGGAAGEGAMACAARR